MRKKSPSLFLKINRYRSTEENFYSKGWECTVQGGSDKSGIFFFLLSNDTAQLKIIRFD
jgi:hypothetical protein